MIIDRPPSMAQNPMTSRSSFSSNNVNENTNVNNHAAANNADDYDSDSSNLATP